MFRFLLLLALAVLAVLLFLRADRRLHDLVLVDLTPGAGVVLHRAWAVLVELWPASGVLAAAVVLLAAALALGLSHLHIRIMLERQREHLDRTYRDRELDAARRGYARRERQLAATKRRLKTALRDLAASKRARRAAEAQRDAALRASAGARRRADGAALLVRDLLASRAPQQSRVRDPDRYPAPSIQPRQRPPPCGDPPAQPRRTS